MRGGMGYGFGGTIGTSGPMWNSAWGGEVTKAGAPVYDSADPQRGSSRRRTKKTRGKTKGKRKGGKNRRRTMRGGAQWQSVADTGYGFTGTGSRALADATPYASKVAPESLTQNADGAFRA